MSESGLSRKERRRNGSEAACEPCRRSKLRCDHARPVCNRCQRRSLQAKCFYHPAPLTRTLTQEATANQAQHLPSPLNSRAASNAGDPGIVTSTSNPQTQRHLRQYTDGLFHEDGERLSLIKEALSALDEFELIRESIRDYYTDSMSANVPRPLILPVISSLTSLVGVSKLFDGSEEASANLQRLAQSIKASACHEIPISASTNAEEFLLSFTGTNIRMEFLGIVFAVASRGHLSSMGRTGVRDGFIRSMTRCCGICYHIAQDFTPMNDVVTWLSLERVTLAMHAYGDQSEQVWQRLGDLSSDILAHNLHREASIARDCPFFLAECRRRTSSKAYYLDVGISSTMGRPSRLSKRFFDVNLPLDLSDEDACGVSEVVEAARIKLDSSGWNTDTPEYFPASFARMRPAMAGVREEAWEIGLRPTTPQSVSRLQELSQRNRQIWETLPSRLHYTSECWHSGVAPRVCQMLMNMYLAYAATEFHICRALKRVDANASGPLLTISVDLVTHISELGSIWMKDAIYDFSFQALYHGWPAAVVLLESLQGTARAGRKAVSLPPGITAPSLIRLLSVLSHQTRTLCEPRQTNHVACVQVSDAISRRLDEIVAALFDGTPQDECNDMSLTLPESDATLIDPALWSDPEMDNLLKDVDWNSISTELGL